MRSQMEVVMVVKSPKNLNLFKEDTIQNTLTSMGPYLTNL